MRRSSTARRRKGGTQAGSIPRQSTHRACTQSAKGCIPASRTAVRNSVQSIRERLPATKSAQSVRWRSVMPDRTKCTAMWRIRKRASKVADGRRIRVPPRSRQPPGSAARRASRSPNRRSEAYRAESMKSMWFSIGMPSIRKVVWCPDPAAIRIPHSRAIRSSPSARCPKSQMSMSPHGRCSGTG